jgi:hypothetical protein
VQPDEIAVSIVDLSPRNNFSETNAMKNSTGRVRRMAFFAFLSWFGLYLHNTVDLPGLTLLSPENSIPAVITLLMFLAWWRMPSNVLTNVVFLAWVFFAQFLIGGILTVLPFAFLPFRPAQTPLHYFMHLVYALTQLPLMIALLRQLKEIKQSEHFDTAPMPGN